MAAEIEVIEERLRSLLSQLLAECGILDRLVYKNKNQHRRSSYFQYLLKVRRDLNLLRSAHLEELLESCFHVVTGRKAKQKVHLLESLKRRNCDTGKYNFMERLLGAARLLSQMVEPILKAAIEISKLFARSFFMGFSLTVMALLARVRVLVQQMLLDIVSVFNEVSSIAQKKQSIKINQDGIEVFREYYPTMEEVVTLECSWQTDEFVLAEKVHRINTKLPEERFETAEPLPKPVMLYRSVEAFLGDSELGFKKDVDSEVDLGKRDDELTGPEEASEIAEEPPRKKPHTGDSLSGSSSCFRSPSLPKSSYSGSKSRVAFISVKKPVPAPTSSTTGLRINEAESKNSDKDDDDPFPSLLSGGTTKSSLF